MNIFVDTSVWSLAFRRDASAASEVEILRSAIAAGDIVVSTGLVLQELLQGFHGPRVADKIVHYFSLLPILAPDVEDHVEAARWRNLCRRKGVQIGTIDALIAQLCIRHSLKLLATDEDFEHMAKHTPLSLLTT